MKIELKKVNEPDGRFWYGVWVDGDCQIPAYYKLEEAQEAFNKIEEQAKTPKPKYELIKEIEVANPVS